MGGSSGDEKFAARVRDALPVAVDDFLAEEAWRWAGDPDVVTDRVRGS
jgi:hypothetical protein